MQAQAIDGRCYLGYFIFVSIATTTAIRQTSDETPASWPITLPGCYARNAHSIYAEEFGDKPALSGLVYHPRIKLNNLIGAQHSFFVLGVASFALFVGLRVMQGPATVH